MNTRFIPHGPLGLGGAPLGNLGHAIPDDVALQAIEAGWGAGIRHFDTAPHYGAGLSERRMGEALRDKPRDSYTLSSKVGRLLEPVDAAPVMDHGFEHGLNFARRLDYTHDGALRSIEGSLQRLGLDRLDIVYIHDCASDWLGTAWREQFDVAMAGAARALTRLREEGVIRAWGFGVNVIEPCLLALEQADPDLFLIAGRYTLLDQSALAELLPACERRDAHVVLGGPYNSGVLAGGNTFDYHAAPSAIVERAGAIATVCARHGVDMKAAALQFCAAHPATAAVIPGPRSAAEAAQNAEMMVQPIPQALWMELKAEGLLPRNAPVPEP